jgi:hypothetical protein
MEDRIAALEATVRDLQARLQLNSTNSSKPPSSDPLGLKWAPRTGQLGGLDLLWSFPADRLSEPGSVELARGSVAQ